MELNDPTRKHRSDHAATLSLQYSCLRLIHRVGYCIVICDLQGTPTLKLRTTRRQQRICHFALQPPFYTGLEC